MYASFDSTATQPTPVTGWYEAMTPACGLVAPVNLLELTQAEWDNRLNTPFVSGALLIAAPIPTASQLTAQAKVTQSAMLNATCASAITSGFSSLALGSAYTYPSGRNDQTNLAANVLSSMYPALPATWTTPQMCCSSAGVWAYVAHTAAQIQQVGLDGKSAILASLAHNATQQAAVLAATKVSAVIAVVW